MATFNFGHEPPPEKKSKSVLEFATAILALAGAIGATASQRVEHPEVWWTSLAVCVFAFAWVMKDGLLLPFKKVATAKRDVDFLIEHRASLPELYKQFVKFGNSNNGNALPSITRSISYTGIAS